MIDVEASPLPLEFDRYTTPEQLLNAAIDKPMPGFPEPAARWEIPAEVWHEARATGVLYQPDGPWDVSQYPKRAEDARRDIRIDPAVVTPENPISAARTLNWAKQYGMVTDKGLPVHPLLRLCMVELPEDARLREAGIGRRLRMATGIGRERYWGAHKIGNLMCARADEDGDVEYAVVTTVRDGKRRVSFPGGYAEPGQTVAEAALAESGQEASLLTACAALGITVLDLIQQPNIMWKLRESVVGPCTVNTWLEEYFWVIDATKIEEMRGVQLASQDKDEARIVSWRKRADILSDRAFMGSHRRIAQAHAKYPDLRLL